MISPSHALYLDDSGQKEYAPLGGTYGSGLSRYFVLGGYLTKVGIAGRLAAKLSAAKIRTFGTAAVEIKSNWLRMPEERKKRYLVPFGLTDLQLNEFVDHFYSAALDEELVLLACVVDKEHMTEDYGAAGRWYPPAVAYEFVVQRAQNELSSTPTSRFSTVMDDMSGKTPNDSEYADNLRRHHEQLKKTGSNFIPLRIGALVGRIKFMNSRDSHLIQLADLVAYNVFRQFRDYGEQWEDEGLVRLPAYDWFRKIAQKFRRDETGRIQGYGVVKAPMRKRVPWTAGALSPSKKNTAP